MSDNEKPSLLEQLKLSQSKERKGLQGLLCFVLKFLKFILFTF